MYHRCTVPHQNSITMPSQWPRRRLKSPASRLFTQSFIRAQIKENIKAPRHWPLCGEITRTGEFPAQRASNAENVSIWWRHYGKVFIQENVFEKVVHELKAILFRPQCVDMRHCSIQNVYVPGSISLKHWLISTTPSYPLVLLISTWTCNQFRYATYATCVNHPVIHFTLLITLLWSLVVLRLRGPVALKRLLEILNLLWYYGIYTHLSWMESAILVEKLIPCFYSSYFIETN